jgi:nicotinate-nucleotide pyrophosphorylase (carboxylating)
VLSNPVLSTAEAAQVAVDVQRALAEDLGSGDVTADLLPDLSACAELRCKSEAVIAGRPWFDACFLALDPSMQIDWQVAEGEHIDAGTVICRLNGRRRALVSAERCALNFLQTLSATATATARHVAVLRGSRTHILDTRKTLPGLRLAQKYAVRAGGGVNHRLGLYDAVMVKENHIAAAGSIAAVVARARALHPGVPVIVEVETLDELGQAMDAQADRVLLDEFDDAGLHAAVAMAAGRVPLEVSGGVRLDDLPRIAASGVDFVSIGSLTKHVEAVDLSLRILPPP